jgi:hypothetical protein
LVQTFYTAIIRGDQIKFDGGKCQLGAPKFEDYIKIELKEIWCEDVDWTGCIGPSCRTLWRSNECLDFTEGMKFLISCLFSAISYFTWKGYH